MGIKYFKDNYWAGQKESTLLSPNPYHFRWDRDKEAYLIKEWNKGTKLDDIARTFNITRRSIQRHIANNRDRLQLSPRKGGKPRTGNRTKAYKNEFDRAWYGCVPFGHWALCKPWRLEDE